MSAMTNYSTRGMRATVAPVGTLITVAPTGAETAKSDCPQLPTTLAELVETAVACQDAGASLIHIHIREGEHRPSLDAEPDSCSLTCGTTNFGDDVFLNPFPFMAQLYRQAQEREIVPEFELFDLGHVAALRRLIDAYGLPFGGKVHVDFITGVPGGMPGTPAALLAGIQALPAEVTSWAATGIGRSHLPIAAAALASGGHLRVGMEDNLSYAKGQPVQRNDELVSRAADLARLMQRPPLTTDEARSLLSVKERRTA